MANYRSVKYDQTLAKSLVTSRTIGGVAFDGTANINLPGVNISGNQNTTGNAATATTLETARTIAGQSFDGAANIDISLGNLSNVDTTGLANNKILKYNSTSSNWEIADDAGGSGIALTDLSVGSEPSASGNGALAYNNSSGVFTYTPPLNISGTAAIATTVTITDNESTNENNAIVFTAGGDVDGGNLGLESDGTLTYNPSTGKITATGFVGTLTGDVTGDVTGNADTATALATARTIGGVSFDGTGNINLPGVNTSGNQDTSGNAATATALATARTIGGVSFDGTGNINLPGVNTSGNQNTSGTAAVATTVTITDNESTNENNAIIFAAGGDQDGGNLGLESDGTLTYNPSTGKITATGFVGTLTGDVTGDVTGNADTATALATARTIGGVSFDGTGNINLPGVNTGGNQDTSGNAATATALETARTIGGVSFDGTGNINLPGVNTGGNQDTSGTAAKVTVTDSTANTNFPVVFHNESNGLLDDTGALRYNPSTGTLLVPNLSVAGTTTQVDTVTMNAQNAVVFEGATPNDFETTLTITDPTADRTITMPDATGTMALTSSDISGNAATATALETARTIGGVSFDGTGNINLPGVNTGGNQDTSGNAATATALETARTIGGVSFDGTGNINLPGVNTSGNQDTSGTAAVATTVTITDNESTNENNALIFAAGGDQDGGNLGLESDGTLTYNPSTGKVTATGFVGALTGDVTGNADTATTLETARTIAGQSFNGSANITIASTDLSNSSAITLNTASQTLTNKTLTTPIANAGIQLKNGATSAGFLEFFEDSDNGTNKVTFIGPASTADVTITLPATAGTVVTTGDSNTVTGTMIDDDTVAEANMADDAIGSAQLKSLSTLLIKNSSGSTLKTIHGAGA